MKRIITFLAAAVFLLNIYGCIPLLVGGAAGAGTAAWLAQKLTQEFPASYGRTVDATEKALKSMQLKIIAINRTDNVTKFRSEDASGKAIWIDIIRIAPDSTKVQIRVGAVSSDKEFASQVLQRIQSYL